MTIALPNRKVHQIQQSVTKMLKATQISTRTVAQLLGLMVAAHPAILPAPLYYRQLERRKIRVVHSQGYDSEPDLHIIIDERRSLLVAEQPQAEQQSQPTHWNTVIDAS